METENGRLAVLNGLIESAQQLEDLASDREHKGVQYVLATASLLANWDAINIWVRLTSPPSWEMMDAALDGLSSLGSKMDDILMPPCSIRDDNQIAEEGDVTDDESDWMHYRLAMRQIREVMKEFRCSLKIHEEDRKEARPLKPSPNPRGRAPKYDLTEDARVFNLYRGQPERISIEDFREETSAIKKAYTMQELRQLLDRERKRRAGEIIKRRRGKGCQ